MASKTFLVAQREYLENIRTKTFWIGILSLPILIAISIGAGFVLNKLKETKTYAVVDLSAGKLGKRIELQARSGDLIEIVNLRSKAEGRTPLTPEQERALAPALANAAEAKVTDVPPEQMERAFDALMNMPAGEFEAFASAQKNLETLRKFKLRSLKDLGVADLAADEQQTRLGQMVKQGQLFGYFVIGKDPLTSLEDFRYVSNNFTDESVRNWYGAAATKVVQRLRIEKAGIASDVAAKLREEVRFAQKQSDETGATKDVTVADKAGGFAPVAFVYLLWIAVFTAAQMLLTNTVEEKSNRIIEVLLSSVSPGELMAGKIWGIGATGMTLTLSWVACAFGGYLIAEQTIQGLDLSMFASVKDPLYLISFIVYFFFGYLLYAAILVGLGSVCNSLKEAQNLLQPVFILLIVPLVSMMFVVQEPNGIVAKVLSYVPLFTPFLMMNRAGGPPELYEYAITSVLLLASVWFAFKAAGKVFRVGVLMTGNPPKLKEIFGWLRQS
jgi:ABC-2 type transport system permease protein